MAADHRVKANVGGSSKEAAGGSRKQQAENAEQ